MAPPPKTIDNGRVRESHDVVRLGVVEDHALLVDGLRLALDDDPALRIVACADSVSGLLAQGVAFDMALLDLSLPDESTPTTNVAALRAAGIERILVLTAGERPDLIRAAARADVAGVVRKSEPVSVLRAAIVDAAAGMSVTTVELAAAIDGDQDRPSFAPREEEVLALYAAGESADDVAANLGISVHTVNMYLRRIRAKYAAAGTPVTSRAALRSAAQRDGFAPRPWWQRH